MEKMKSRLLIITGISVTVFLIGVIVYPTINEVTFDDDFPHDLPTALTNTDHNAEDDQLQKILDYCYRESMGFGVLDILFELTNGTHYINNNICEWKSIEKDQNPTQLGGPIIIPNELSDSKLLECYDLFHCDSAKQNFEECVNSYQHGFTVKSICQFSNVTVNGGCVGIPISNDSRIMVCD